MKHLHRYLVLIAVALVSGCSSLPERIDELENARQTVAAANNEPMAGKVAGPELEAAREALSTAEKLREQNADLADIRHFAYVATRHAEIAMERTAEAEARSQIEASEAERTRIQLQARTREAEQAEALAETRAVQAALNAQEAERQRQRAENAIDRAEVLADSLDELKAEQTERGLVLTLSDVLFDTDRSELKEGVMPTMDRLAEFLRDDPNRALMIEGHTDSRGDDAYNRALSQRRADAVRAALIARGIDAARLRAVGLGEAYPLASNDTVAGRQENRRVEIVVSDRDGEFPTEANRSAALAE